MPAALTYPGVYIEEVASGVRTIMGVATSIAAFVGRTQRGPVNRPIVINGFADFERRFGGLWEKSALGFAVRDFFVNGGGRRRRRCRQVCRHRRGQSDRGRGGGRGSDDRRRVRRSR